MKSLPNILSVGRILLTLLMFAALLAVGGGAEGAKGLRTFAFWAFVIAAVTDFFDGWLARKLDAVSLWGTILDPIGDKILVCGAVVGLLAVGAGPDLAWPAGLILFREFTVSALREVGAARGLKLPVTQLAKWKTTLQLVALGAYLLPGLPPTLHKILIWVAAAVTLITGAQYMVQTHRGLKDA